MPVALHYALHREHRAASLLIGDGRGCSLLRREPSAEDCRLCVLESYGSRQRCAYVPRQRDRRRVPPLPDERRGAAGLRRLLYRAHRPGGGMRRGLSGGLKTIDPHLESLQLPVHIFWGDTDAFLGADNVPARPTSAP